jgi:chromosome segregation ATPase
VLDELDAVKRTLALENDLLLERLASRELALDDANAEIDALRRTNDALRSQLANVVRVDDALSPSPSDGARRQHERELDAVRVEAAVAQKQLSLRNERVRQLERQLRESEEQRRVLRAASSASSGVVGALSSAAAARSMLRVAKVLRGGSPVKN